MGLGVQTARFLLFIFNFLFFVMGIVIITVGAIVASKSGANYNLLSEGSTKFTEVPVAVIIVGVIVTLVSFFGCFGAARNSRAFLLTFAIIVSIIFVLEFGLGIAAYVFHGKLGDALKDGMMNTFKNYKNDTVPEYKKDWDNIQDDLSCCGVNGPADYLKELQMISIPGSCCGKLNTTTPQTCGLEEAYPTGCWDKLLKNIEGQSALLGAIGIAFAFIQLLGIVMSCCLVKRSKYGEYV